ncbi:MAG TPA: hypothetical protein VFK36_12080 [Gemmatimonadales bacterium]|jgi:hypothetical protein|nr:hypothetical protein [Gemmatimonadales bacterium]
MTDFMRTIVSPDSQHRAVIHRRPDGFFAVQFEQFDDSAVTGIGGMSDPFWRVTEPASIVASLDEAERLASDRFGLAPA